MQAQLGLRGSWLLLLTHMGLPRGAALRVTLAKPLGLLLEEADRGGAVVAAVLATGSAAASAAIRPGDCIVGVGGSGLDDFDGTMDALAAAADPVALEIERPADAAPTARFPNGAAVPAAPGDSLGDLALQARYRVPLDCREGHCGVCEMYLRRELDGGGEAVRAVRVCKARMPAGCEAVELLEPDDEAAQASNEELQAALRAELRAKGRGWKVRDAPPAEAGEDGPFGLNLPWT